MAFYRKIGLAGVMVFIILFFGWNSAFAYEVNHEEPFKKAGPISIRNQMPLYLIYLQFVPDKAEPVERNKVTINADYTVSNITVSAFTPATSLYDVQIDAEVSRATIDFRYGLYDNCEIGLEVPYISLSGGYLDNFVESIEDGIGARTPRSRERQGSYEFAYSFKYNNNFLIDKQHSMQGLGDIVLHAKYQLLKEERLLPDFSVRSAVKFPTGEKKDLLGSGELDYGIGILMDKGFFDRLFIYAGANVVWIEKPSFFSVLGVQEQIYSGMLAMEYFLSRRFSFVAQVSGNTTPYPVSDTNPLDNNAYEFGLGVNYSWREKDNVSWHFAFTENIKAASSPDVSLHTGLSWKF